MRRVARSNNASKLSAPILQNKVDARNKVNALALQYREDLVEILTPYLGKKIRKVSHYDADG